MSEEYGGLDVWSANPVLPVNGEQFSFETFITLVAKRTIDRITFAKTSLVRLNDEGQTIDDATPTLATVQTVTSATWARYTSIESGSLLNCTAGHKLDVTVNVHAKLASADVGYLSLQVVEDTTYASVANVDHALAIVRSTDATSFVLCGSHVVTATRHLRVALRGRTAGGAGLSVVGPVYIRVMRHRGIIT